MATFDVYKYVTGVHHGGIYGTDTDVDWRAMLKDIQAMLLLFNQAEVAALTSTLTQDTILETVKQTVGALTMVEGTEAREPDVGGNKEYEFALPLTDFELGFALTRKAEQRIAPQKIITLFGSAMQAYLQQQLKNVFRPIFGKTKCGAEWGGTWQANTDCPDFQANTFFGSAHSHLFARSAATLTLAHIRMMVHHIQHHGFGRPGAVGQKQIVMLINSAQGDDIKALGDWGVVSGLPESVVERLSLDGIQANQGLDAAYVNMSEMVPEDYVVMLALDPPSPIVHRRIEARPSAQGLVLETPFENSQFPFRDSNYTCAEGCTVTQPSAVVVLKLGAGGDSSQSDLTHYTVPDYYAA